jgi:hypothetical protein
MWSFQSFLSQPLSGRHLSILKDYATCQSIPDFLLTLSCHFSEQDLCEIRDSGGKFGQYVYDCCRFYHDWHLSSDHFDGTPLFIEAKFYSCMRFIFLQLEAPWSLFFMCNCALSSYQEVYVLNLHQKPLAYGSHIHWVERIGQCWWMLDMNHGPDLLLHFHRDLSSRSYMHGSTAWPHAIYVQKGSCASWDWGALRRPHSPWHGTEKVCSLYTTHASPVQSFCELCLLPA